MPRVHCAAKAIIIDKNKFLVLKYAKGDFSIWDLPGGGIKYGESPDQALIREVKEKTKLDIKINKILGVFWFFYHINNDQRVCLTYQCKITSNNKIDILNNTDEESNEKFADYRWITKGEFLSNKDYNNCHVSLKKLISEKL
ncbi:MAG: NUDIX hydrolase [Candidatus Falkowbacteria bacterium]